MYAIIVAVLNNMLSAVLKPAAIFPRKLAKMSKSIMSLHLAILSKVKINEEECCEKYNTIITCILLRGQLS